MLTQIYNIDRQELLPEIIHETENVNAATFLNKNHVLHFAALSHHVICVL